MLSSISHCYIDCLPTETLEAIFIDCASHYYSTATGDQILNAPSCTSVSYVNRRWRDIALNCSVLWTYLFNTSPRWTEELLARSKQAPLKLFLNLHYSYQNLGLRILEQVMNHVERIQELRIHLWCSAPEVLSLLSLPAPRLQNLEILLSSPPLEWSVLFDGKTPALHALEFTCCPIMLPLMSPQMSGLKTLILRDFSIDFQMDMVEFLTMLGSMQDLSYLHLDDVLRSANSFLSNAAFHRKIELPHLSHLLISAPLSTIDAFLSCVNAPLNMEVRLDCGGEDEPSIDDFVLFYSLLARRFRMSEDQPLYNHSVHSLNIAFTDQGDVKITFSPSNYDDDTTLPFCVIDADWGLDIPLQIALHWPHYIKGSDWADITSRVCLPTPLSYIQNLYVSNPPSPPAFWMHVLECLPGLRYIKLSEGDMPPIAPFLVPPSRHRTHIDLGDQENDCSGRGGDQMFVPELAELELYDIVFSAESGSDPPNRADLQSLCDALSARKVSRVRLSVTDSIKGNPERTEGEELNMVGQWEGDRFCIEHRDSELEMV